MSQPETAGDSIDLHVEISEIPTSGIPSPAPEVLPPHLADTGSEPLVLLLAVGLFALGALVAGLTRRHDTARR